MRIYQELATGIGVLCFGNHIGQIVDGLFIVLIDSIESICLDKNTEQIGEIVDYPPVTQDTAVGQAPPQQHTKKEEWRDL